MRKLIFLMAFLCLSVSEAANAERIYKYYEPSFLYTQEIDDSVKPLEPEELAEKIYTAKTGDNEACYMLGYMYEFGTEYAYGVYTSYPSSRQWYELAAGDGHVKSMIALGRLYKKGGQVGFPRKVKLAIKWFGDAARRGSAEGLYELGIIYEMGDGIVQSDAKALEVYELASAMGFLNAQIKAALFYQYARGTKKDYVKAVKYMKQAVKSAKSEDKDRQQTVQNLLANIYIQISDIQDDTVERLKWRMLAAGSGSVESQLYLADSFMGLKHDEKVSVNYPEATKWFKKAAEMDNVYSMKQLGYIYSNGLGTDKDYKKAFSWYLQAAEKGDPESAWNLGTFYLNGLGIRRDDSQAQKWFSRSKILQRKKKTRKRRR